MKKRLLSILLTFVMFSSCATGILAVENDNVDTSVQTENFEVSELELPPRTFIDFPSDETEEELYDWEIELKPQVEAILQQKTLYSSLTEDEKKKVNDFYRLNREYMQGWETRGYTIEKSIPLATAMKRNPFTYSDIEQLIEIYGYDNAVKVLDDFRTVAVRRVYLEETFEFAKQLLLDYWQVHNIMLLYDVAIVFNMEVEEIVAYNDQDYTSGESDILSADDLELLTEYSEIYSVKRSAFITYLEENSLDVSILEKILPSPVETLGSYSSASGSTIYGFNAQNYPEAPTVAEGITVVKGYGNVMYNDEPIVLLGKNGLDLTISATYDSSASKKGLFGFIIQESQIDKGLYAVGSNWMYSYKKTATNHFAHGWVFNFSKINIFYFGDYRLMTLSDGRSFGVNVSRSGKVTLSGVQSSDLRMEESYVYETEEGSTTYKYALFYSDGKKEFFNTDGNVVLTEDRYGNKITYEYTNDNNTVTITDTFGRIVTIVKTDNAVTVTLPDNTQKIYNLVTETLSNGEGTEDFQNVASITDRAGNTTQFTYNNSVETFSHFSSFSGVEPYEFPYSRMEQVIYPTEAKTICQYARVREDLSYGDEWIHRCTLSYDEQNNTRYNELVYAYSYDYGYVTNITYPDGTIGQFYGTGSLLSNESYFSQEKTGKKYISREYSNYKPTKIRQYSEIYEKMSVITAEYDEYRRVTKEVDNGFETNYTYGANDLMLTKTYNQNAQTTILQENTLTADEKGIAKTTIKSNGVVKSETEYEHDTYGNIVKIIEHPETDVDVVTEIQYTYNSDGTLTITTTKKDVKDADGLNPTDITVVQQYDIMGRLTAQTDANGGITRYTYDNKDRILTETTPSGAVTTYQYSDTENYIIITDANGSKLKYKYDDLGNISQISRFKDGAYQTEAAYTYDNMCRAVSVTEYREGTEAKGIYTTIRQYDAIGRVLDETTTQGETVVYSLQYTYDEASSNTLDYVTVQATNTGGATPAVYKYAYDVRGLLKEETIYEVTDLYSKTSYTYDNVGNVLTVSSTRSEAYGGNEVEYQYDHNNQVISEKNIEGNQKTYTYDMMGRLISESDYMGNTTTHTYDEAGRVIKTRTPIETNMNSDLRYYYDDNGNVVKQKNSNSVTENQYDSENHLTRVTSYSKYVADSPDECVKTVVSYTYDLTGNMLTMTQEDGENSSVTRYEYDNKNHCIKTTDALGQTETYTRNLYGDILTHTDRNGTEFTYEYNFLRKPTFIGSYNENNGGADNVTYTYDLLGNRLSMTDKTGTTTYIYDFMSRLTQEEKDGKIKEYSYTVYGDLSSFKIYDGTDQVYVNNYTYDSMSRIVSTGNDASPAQFVYNANSQVTKKTLGDIVTTYSYNKIGGVKTIGTVRDSESIYSMSYTYNNKGNITEEDGTALSVSTGAEHTYDGMNRVTYTKSYNGSVSKSSNPTYDAKNNMQKALDNNYPLYYDLNNRLIKKEIDVTRRVYTTDYVYDNNGNLCISYPEEYVQQNNSSNKSGVSTNDEDVKIYEYDNFNRLIRYQCGETVANYEYNGDGQRVSKSVNGETTYFIWNGTDMVYEYTADGDAASYTYGPTGILYRKLSTDTDTLYTYTTNYRGDVVVMTNGTTHEEYHYTAFGVTYHTKKATETGTILDNPFRYCGEYTDSETGLIYLRNRYYDPTLGRFITEDPIKDGYNWYVYCENNSVMFVDPTGTIKEGDDELNESIQIILNGTKKDGSGGLSLAWSLAGTDAERNAISAMADKIRCFNAENINRHMILVNTKAASGLGHTATLLLNKDDQGLLFSYYSESGAAVGNGQMRIAFLNSTEWNNLLYDNQSVNLVASNGTIQSESYNGNLYLTVSASNGKNGLAKIAYLYNNPGEYNLATRNCDHMTSSVALAANIFYDKRIMPNDSFTYTKMYHTSYFLWLLRSSFNAY